MPEGKTRKRVGARQLQQVTQKDVLVKDVKSQTNCNRLSRHPIGPEKNLEDHEK